MLIIKQKGLCSGYQYVLEPTQSHFCSIHWARIEMTGAPKHNYTQERSTIIIPSGGVEKKRIKKNIFDNQTV